MDRLIKENKAICEPSLTCPHDEAHRPVNFQFKQKSLKLLDVPRSFRLFLLWICKRTAGTFHRRRSKCEKHGGFLMNKLLSCRYNMDTNRVEARFEDETTLAIDCIAIEDEYGNTPAQRAELDWLLYNKPLEYAQLVLRGEIEHYLSLGCDHGRLED